MAIAPSRQKTPAGVANKLPQNNPDTRFGIK